MNSKYCGCLIKIIIILCFYNYAFSSENNIKVFNDDKSNSDHNILFVTLEHAINLALQANRNILSSGYSLQSQRLSLSSAQSEFELKIVPTANAGIGGGGSDSQNVGVGFSVQKKLHPGTVISTGPEINKSDDIYDTRVGISITQPLLRGYGKEVNLDSIRSAEFSLLSADRILYQTQVNTVLETVSAYYGAIKEKQNITIYETMIKRLKGHAEVARAKEQVGLATPMDTFRAEIRLKDAEDLLTRSREAFKNELDRLKTILSLPLEIELEIVDPEEVDIVEMVLENSIHTALKNRVEIEQTKAEIKETERRVQILKNKTLPELNLVIDYEQFGSSDSFKQSTSLDENRWGISIQSTTDLFRTSEKASYRQGLLDLQTLRLQFEEKQDEIKRQVRSQLTTFREADKRINIRKDQIKHTQGKLALAEIKFAYDMADNFDVIEAETEFQTAKVNLVASKTDYAVDLYNMKAILGTLIERN